MARTATPAVTALAMTPILFQISPSFSLISAGVRAGVVVVGELSRRD